MIILWLFLACIILVLGIAPCMLSSQTSQAEEVLAHTDEQNCVDLYYQAKRWDKEANR